MTLPPLPAFAILTRLPFGGSYLSRNACRCTYHHKSESIWLRIMERMKWLQRGEIASLYNEAMAVFSWTAPTDQPDRTSNREARIDADADNCYCSGATAWVCSDAKVAPIGPNNIDSIHNIYLPKAPMIGFPSPPKTAVQRHKPPGDICKTI